MLKIIGKKLQFYAENLRLSSHRDSSEHPVISIFAMYGSHGEKTCFGVCINVALLISLLSPHRLVSLENLDGICLCHLYTILDANKNYVDHIAWMLRLMICILVVAKQQKQVF